MRLGVYLGLRCTFYTIDMLYVVKVIRENIQKQRREKVRPRDEPPLMKHGSCRICKEKFLPGDNLLTMDKELDQLVRIRCGCVLRSFTGNASQMVSSLHSAV